MLKEFLSQKGVLFRELDVSRDQAAAQELVNKTGRSAVPVTVIDGQTIVGFDRMRLEQFIGLAQMREKRKPAFGASVADAGNDKGAVAGAYVGKVSPDSPAEKMGLRQEDVITELNKQPIASAADLENALSKLDKGSRIWVVFHRGDSTKSAEGVL